MVDVHKAVGMVLCHDMTKIVRGEFKGRAFKKGHIVCKEDIPELLKMGKEHIYVWEKKPGMLHENEAAKIIAEAVMGDNLGFNEPSEGKCVFTSKVKGLFEVDSDLLVCINSIPMISVATLPRNFPVNKGQKVAGARIVPLIIQEEYVNKVKEICKNEGPAIKVTPYNKLKAGIVVTGSEVYKGLIKDEFGPVMEKKLRFFDANILGRSYCPDNIEDIKTAIIDFKEKNADIVLVTGGMSVDPDDKTPGAIKKTGAKIVSYGAPVQPGNMILMAYLENMAVLGVPGCAMYNKTTVLDVILPRIFAGHILQKKDFVILGEGGFCAGCSKCHYPICSYCR